MNKRFSRNLLATSIAAGLALEAAPAMAQLEEVVVMARKRDETILQVPATTTVVDAEALEQFAIDDIKGVATMVPGLNFSQGPLSSGVLMSLRGIGTASNNPFMDQSIALVADSMQFTQGLAFAAAMFDLAQVEVLKGPQALFFGKAAPGGVISVRSNDPTEIFEATGRLGYEFEAEEKLGEVIVSGPVTDTLGLRLAGQYSESDGMWENDAVPGNSPTAGAITGSPSLGAAPVQHKNFPETQSVLLKGTAVWDPTENFNAKFKVSYSDVDSQGSGHEPQIIDCSNGKGGIFGALGVDFLAGEDCKLDKTHHLINMDPAYWPAIYNGGEPFAEVTQDFGSLELNYDFGNNLMLTSVTGFYDVKSESMLAGNLSTGFAGPLVIQGKFMRNDYTQELRLASDYDAPVNFIIGAFYEKGYSEYKGNLPANQAFAPLVALRGADWPSASFGSQYHDMEVEAKSVFGQVLWQFAQDLELGVGTRFTDESRSDRIVDHTDERNGDGPAFEVALEKPEISSETWSPEVSLTWTPTMNLTVFGNLKQAYKSGSFDASGGVASGEDAAFDDERVRGGELGLKSRLFDETVAVNATGYLYKYADLQVEENVFDPESGVAGVRTANAATAKVYGLDFDITFAPPAVDGLILFAAVNWNKARYEDFEDALCFTGQTIAQGCNLKLSDSGTPSDPADDYYTAQDLSGEPLLRAPEWTGNFGVNYQMPLSDDMTLRFGTNTTFSSDYVAATDAYPDAHQSGYQKTSANIGLVGAGERWMLEVIGDNLGDKLTFGNCAGQTYGDTLVFGKPGAGTGTAGGTSPTQTACYIENGRTTWLRLTVKI